MNISYKYRIYPNREQEQLIHRTFGCCRFVFNYYLAQRMDAYQKERKSPSLYEQQKHLTSLKRQEETKWLKEVDSTALQSSLEHLDAAYQHFFRRVKQGQKPGFPKYKSKRCHKQSYKSKCAVSTIKVLEKAVQLPKLGLVRCRVSQPIQGRILSATVSRSASGKYYVSVCCQLEQGLPKLPSTTASVGLDMGIKSFAVSSDGIKWPNHKYLRLSEKKLKRLQHQLSRKTKGSCNWKKTRIRIAKCYEHIANQRRDMQQKLSTDIIRQYHVICIEDLASSNLVQNHKMAKSISDAAWGEFHRQLSYKAAWYGRKLITVDRFYASSQICSVCGTKWGGTRNLNVRKWSCPCCQSFLDRDLNAATNILREGLLQMA